MNGKEAMTRSEALELRDATVSCRVRACEPQLNRGLATAVHINRYRKVRKGPLPSTSSVIHLMNRSYPQHCPPRLAPFYIHTSEV
jgi:hypothetical protein